ncbi:MAG: aspartate/glutamate racemase family protein [Deltaproteobacteria bacterium]|nr:aspartate/glutamate racemase family protein [Deltaproteobacteria bacterium]
MDQKIIGVLGGMGPEATLQFLKLIVSQTPAVKDQDHLRIIIDNNPKIPDRTAAILGEGDSPVPALVQSAQALQRAGADFITIPCITAHYFIEELQDQIDLPCLSIIEETLRKVTNRPKEFTRIGLLASLGTIKSGIFQNAFSRIGLETVLPSVEDEALVMRVIYALKNTMGVHDRSRLSEEVLGVVERMCSDTAQATVLGCTELSLLFPEPTAQPMPLLDPLNILAQAAIRVATPIP